MTTTTRTLSITYGGTTFEATAGYHLQGVYVTERDYNTLTVRFQVLVQHDTVSTFQTKCATLETAMRTPNSNLKVTWNLTDVIDLSHSGNTGMNARGSARKVGSAADTDRSRLYDCSVTVMLPADEAGKNGRQSAEVRLTQDGSEAIHLDVSAVYIASAGVSGLSQAQTNFPTYVGTLQTAAGGTWDEYASITYSHDVENKVCTARASYKQILAAQSQDATNDTTLQGVWTEVTTDRVNVGADPGGTAPLIQIKVRFFARVRSTVSTNLVNVWETKARPHMIAIARSYSSTNTITTVRERPGLRPQDNSINAAMTFLAPESALIRADTNIATVDVKPYRYEPVLDGDPFSRDRHNRPGFKGAAIATTVLLWGEVPFHGGEANAQTPLGFELHYQTEKLLKGLDYVVTQRSQPTFKQIEFEAKTGTTPLYLTSIARVTQMEYVKLRKVRPRTGGGGGAGGAGRTRTRGQAAGFWTDRD